MKKALIILLLFILPLHAMAALQRSFAHLAEQSGGTSQMAVKHVSEHASFVPHHHDEHDDGDDDNGTAHEDDSAQSFKHLVDIDQGSGMQVLMPAVSDFSIGFAPGIAPIFNLKSFFGRTTLPLLRPPRARV